MFRKQFKIKSNSQIKGSERKTIKEAISKAFPALTELELEDLLPKKEIVNSIKVLTASDETIQVYTIAKRPMLFDVRGRLFPTIYLLWRYPRLVHQFTVGAQVMQFIDSGADLMTPGVLTPPPQANQPRYGALREGDTAAVHLSTNSAAVAVGVAAQSSNSMLAGKGKCLIIHHSLGDRLCTMEGMAALPVPGLGPPQWLKFDSYQDDFPELGATHPRPTETKQVAKEESTEIVHETTDETTKSDVNDNEPQTVEEMDALLLHSFFVAIKYSKTLTLPILTSNFYKLQILPVGNVDLKRTSYKKLKPFLDEMNRSNIIEVKEIKKGVEAIVSINKNHEQFSKFYLEPSLRPKKAEDEALITTNVVESYIITPSVFPIFAESGRSRGDTVQMAEIRRLVAEYVKKNGCQTEQSRFVRPKGALVKICKTESEITWEEVMEWVCESMKNCFKITSGKEEILNKGKVAPIILSISRRSGNKKVTLVDNLELYGVRIPEFAKECQHGVAASTSISRPPGNKCDQLLVQGNQILFIHSLLTEKHKIPAKYIRGLELAPKRKK